MELQRAKDEADGEIAGLAPCPGATTDPKSPQPTLADTQVDTIAATEEELAENLQQPGVTNKEVQETENPPRPVATPTRTFKTRRTFGGSVWEDAQGQPEDSPPVTPTELEGPSDTPLDTPLGTAVGTPPKTPGTDDGDLGSPCKMDGYENVLESSPKAANPGHVTWLYIYIYIPTKVK